MTSVAHIAPKRTHTHTCTHARTHARTDSRTYNVEKIKIKIKLAVVRGPFNCYITQRACGGMSVFPENSITKIYGSSLLALRGGGGFQMSRKKHYVTLEWPLLKSHSYYKK